MDCTLCNEIMQPDHRTIKMVCCPAEAHTQCFMTHISQYYGPRCFACDTVFYEYNHHYHQPQTGPPPLDTPEFRAAVREIKKARAAKNKAVIALNRAVREVAIGFKAQSAPLISSLKAMKREAIFTTKLTQGWRDGSRATRSYTMLLCRFQKRFAIGSHDLRALGLRQRYSWCIRPANILRRKFRVRI